MEALNVNQMLSSKISKISNSLLPPGFEGDVRSIRLMQESLSKVINGMGVLSADEQDLSKIVTSATKLRTADGHILYLYKDASANEGKGEVQGMLKVGHKHLYLYDEKNEMHEVDPLCVLDFFVMGKCQRLGIGKMLFEYMLEDWNTSAEQLAVDGPSEKMEAFLAKNYGMSPLIRHSNNFAISPRFFHITASNSHSSKSTGSKPQQTGAVGRFTAHKPHSSIASVIHGGPSNGEPDDEGGATYESPAPSEETSPQPETETSPQPETEPAPAQARARPRTLPVSAAPPALAPVHAPAPALVSAGAPSRLDSQLTDKGFFDIKFHHRKLW